MFIILSLLCCDRFILRRQAPSSNTRRSAGDVPVAVPRLDASLSAQRTRRVLDRPGRRSRFVRISALGRTELVFDADVWRVRELINSEFLVRRSHRQWCPTIARRTFFTAVTTAASIRGIG